MESLEPVSYTHLDVYKRQVEHRVQRSGLVLRTDGAVLDAAAVGDEDQIVFGQVHPLLVVVHQKADGAGLLFAVRTVELDVRHLRVVVEPDPVADVYKRQVRSVPWGGRW